MIRQEDTQSITIAAVATAGAITAASFLIFEFPTAMISCLLGWLMLAITVSDARSYIIPDIVSLPAIPAGLLATGALAVEGGPSAAVLHHLGAALSAGAILYGLAAGYEMQRGRSGLGLGDVKLMMVAGAWTGWLGASHVLLTACLAALAFVAVEHLGSRRAITATTAIPFGAFLAPAIWIVWAIQQL